MPKTVNLKENIANHVKLTKSDDWHHIRLETVDKLKSHIFIFINLL